MPTREIVSHNVDAIRNFCVVAHVDHGKTTLSDFLIASNGLLAPALAGKVRFLDSREDEQVREITMKTSGVALHHTVGAVRYSLTLVDSPGHIDFSSEVSAAIDLCDGALVVVDVVDGVTPQTKSALQLVYSERLSVTLVLNKMDLLITTQQLSPFEAMVRLVEIVAICNGTLAALSEIEPAIGGEPSRASPPPPKDEAFFCPTKGNVLFTSCLDGWGFSLKQFAEMYSKKLGRPVEELNSALWQREPSKADAKPLFVTNVLQPIWTLYEVFSRDPFDMEFAAKLSMKLGIAADMWNFSSCDCRGKLGLLMGHWLPVAICVLDNVCESFQSPATSMRARLARFFPKGKEGPPLDANVEQALVNCDQSETAPVVAFVAKLLDADFVSGAVPVGEGLDDSLVGVTRVCSGRLKRGAALTLLSGGKQHEISVGSVHLLRGRGLVEVQDVPAGHLCAISGIAPFFTKIATLTSVPLLPPMRPVGLLSSSVLRLSVAARNVAEMPKLLRGLKLLHQVDRQVDVMILPDGEHVLCCAGEVHSERCLVDLRERFAVGVELEVSKPHAPFRETIVATGAALKRKPVTCRTPDGQFAITMCALPLPGDAMELLQKDEKNSCTLAFAKSVQTLLLEGKERKRWRDVDVRKLWSFGPTKHRYCGCLLFDCTSGSREGEEISLAPHALEDAICCGFQLACNAGTMAEEPLFGIAFCVMSLELHEASGPAAASSAPLAGQVMIAVRDACRQAVALHPRRLVEPVCRCIITSSACASRGKIFALLHRLRGEILEEVPSETIADQLFISAYLPAVESFGFQDELRRETSGAAAAQLHMSHWGIVASDPYWVPTTKEEIELEGAQVSRQNTGAALLEAIRRRKGLHRENAVANPEKQKFSQRGA